MKPDNHVSNFPPEWWSERRRQDYFVDQGRCVQLVDGSETADRLHVVLTRAADKLALH
jgi:hypothetical protein